MAKKFNQRPLLKNVLNQPQLITPEGMREALDFLKSHDGESMYSVATKDNMGPPPVDTSEGRVAQITMHGPMLHRATFLESLCGAQSYETYRKQIDSAFQNENVEIVVLALDSPGGSASGLFDLSEHIYNKKKEYGKRVIAYVDGMAASAAFGIAAAADEIIVEKSSSVGSIGVITTHVSVEKQLEEDGIEVTPIYAGKWKAAGNPYESLSDDVRAMIQERVDTLYNMFVGSVAKMRDMNESAIRDTEAKVYFAEEAVKIGLADKIMSLDEFNEYLAEEDEDSMPISFGTNSQESAVSNVDKEQFEAMQAELTQLKEDKEKMEALTAEKEELSTKLKEYEETLAAKAEEDRKAQMAAYEEQAKDWSAFGVDAKAFAEVAMDADESLVNMFSAAMDAAKEKMEADHPDFKEAGSDAEGEGLKSEDETSPVMKAIDDKYKKESK